MDLLGSINSTYAFGPDRRLPRQSARATLPSQIFTLHLNPNRHRTLGEASPLLPFSPRMLYPESCSAARGCRQRSMTETCPVASTTHGGGLNLSGSVSGSEGCVIDSVLHAASARAGRLKTAAPHSGGEGGYMWDRCGIGAQLGARATAWCARGSYRRTWGQLRYEDDRDGMSSAKYNELVFNPLCCY